jgi:hypothetical protein
MAHRPDILKDGLIFEQLESLSTLLTSDGRGRTDWRAKSSNPFTISLHRSVCLTITSRLCFSGDPHRNPRAPATES